MTPLESLYYAIGELAYAIACADGTIQQEERMKFNEMVTKQLDFHNHGFDISSIIFQIMVRDKASLPDSYHWAIKEIKLNSHYLSPRLKRCFITVMEKVAAAFPPVTIEEKALIDKFREDIEPLEGDPVYYES